jgi:hypothetical protein
MDKIKNIQNSMLLSDLKECCRDNALEKVRQYPRHESYILYHFEIIHTCCAACQVLTILV